MKKRIVAICLVVALAAVAIAGGTMAYLTDTDSKTNVMTVGNVNIRQNEQQIVNGEVVDFVNDKRLFPVTGDTNGDGKIDTGFDHDLGTFDFASPAETKGGRLGMFPNFNNVIDKIVTVTNEGKDEAYVRTLFAYELPTVEYAKSVYGGELPEYVSTLKVGNKEYVDVVNTPHFLITSWHQGLVEGMGDVLPKDNGEYVIIEINGKAYLVSEYYYKNESKLAVDETSHPSLKQIYMSALASNEDAQVLTGADGEFDILVLTQGVQTAGFTSAREALETAFGKITIENATEWFKNVEP